MQVSDAMTIYLRLITQRSEDKAERLPPTHSLTPNNNGTNQRRRYSCPSSGRWRVTAIHTILLHRTMERTVGEGGSSHQCSHNTPQHV